MGEYFYDYILNIEGTDVYLVFVFTTNIQHAGESVPLHFPYIIVGDF